MCSVCAFICQACVVSCFPDKLDGLRLKKQHQSEPRNMEEFLQLSDDYETRKSDTGKKHVSGGCKNLKTPLKLYEYMRRHAAGALG